MMAAEWTVVTRGTFTAHVARVAGYDLPIFGGDALWTWFIDLNEQNVTEGAEHDLAAAKIAAEVAARRLAGDPEAT
jgi:hypothetical protein